MVVEVLMQYHRNDHNWGIQLCEILDDAWPDSLRDLRLLTTGLSGLQPII